jgi:hypothetical protein
MHYFRELSLHTTYIYINIYIYYIEPTIELLALEEQFIVSIKFGPSYVQLMLPYHHRQLHAMFLLLDWPFFQDDCIAVA